MKKGHDFIYRGMLVYADFDKTQVGLRIAIDTKVWYNTTENFVFLEGVIPTEFEGNDNEVTQLFKKLKELNNSYNYFVIVNSEWSKEFIDKKSIIV